MMPLAADTTLRWALETNWTWAPWVTAVVVAALVLFVIWLYRTEVSPAGAIYRGLLAALRLASFAIILAMLSELVLSSSRLSKPRLAVVLDRSASMLEPANDDADESRYAAALQALTSGEQSLLQQLGQRYELAPLTVGAQVEPLVGTSADEIATQLSALQPETVEASQSRLGDALATAIEPRLEAAPTAVVLLTDGRTTSGRSLAQATAAARQRGVPLHVVGLGSTRRPADIALAALQAERIVFADDLVAVQVQLSAQGVSGQQVSLSLVDLATNEPVAQQSVDVQSNELTQGVTLVFEPEKVGDYRFQLVAKSAASEDDTTNNAIEFPLTVRDDPIRVLLAAGYPSYEFRYLKSLLDRDRKFQLATFLQEADLDYARQDASAIAQLPLTTEQFAEFDVVVLLDVDPRLLPPLLWQSLEALVSERGGGLLLAAGPRSYPWNYAQNAAIARLSPIEVGGAGGGMVDEGYQPQWTPLASQLVNLQLAKSPAESQAIWQSLPPHYWYADVVGAKPSASILAEHPRARTSAGSALPLVALQYYGAGRVWYQGFDDTWRWRLRVGDAFFAKYWGQTLRMLARAKLAADAAGVTLTVDEPEYAAGDKVRLSLQASANSAATLAATPPQVVIERLGGSTERVVLERSPIGGRFASELRNLPPGNYRASLVEPLLDPLPAAAEFRLVAPPGELSDITQNRSELAAAATATLGHYYTLGEVDQLLENLPRGEQLAQEALPPQELWNSWWMLTALTACLVSEWILRKRKAML